MSGKISQTKYKDIEAVSMESRLLEAVFLPLHGAKMASLKCKETGREFLVQADGRNYKKLEYAGDYVAAECSGFDDMFPNIDEYEYKDFPWEGAVMPDHGEVCGLPWEYEILESGNCLHCWVYSLRFAYRIDKWVRFNGDDELTMEYEAKNLSPFDLDFIWAGHIMINAQEGARITLPYKNGSEVTCVFCSDRLFAKPDDTLVWPQTVNANGEQARLDITGERSTDGKTYKYYFDEAVPEGWCKYTYSDGTGLELKFDNSAVPYLGIWVNDGAFKGYHNIAFEPCTGTFDDPGRAKQHGQNSVLQANGEYAWIVRLNIKSN